MSPKKFLFAFLDSTFVHLFSCANHLSKSIAAKICSHKGTLTGKRPRFFLPRIAGDGAL